MLRVPNQADHVVEEPERAIMAFVAVDVDDNVDDDKEVGRDEENPKDGAVREVADDLNDKDEADEEVGLVRGRRDVRVTELEDLERAMVTIGQRLKR